MAIATKAMIVGTMPFIVFPWLVSAMANDVRAHFNYVMHCQGCHLPEAVGFEGKVPPIKNFIGYFLQSREGREYIIRVPGVAMSQLSDDEIAELMNWLIDTYSTAQRPNSSRPYTAAEVGVLRSVPDFDPPSTRAKLLTRLGLEKPSPSQPLPRQPD